MLQSLTPSLSATAKKATNSATAGMTAKVTGAAAQAQQAAVAKATGAATKGVEVAAAKATEKATDVAVTQAAKQMPGGKEALEIAKKLGMDSSQILETITTAPTKISNFFASMSPNTKLLLFGSAFAIIVITIVVVMYNNSQKKSTPENVKNVAQVQRSSIQEKASALGQQTKGLPQKKKEGFKNPEAAAAAATDDLRLVNLQPFTIKQAGFVGPLEAGVFEEKSAVEQALKAGIRTFMLQIDYHEDSTKFPPTFPEAGEPCLLYRNDAGTLTSLNAGSIRKVAETISQYAFSNEVVAKEDPVVLILHGLRTPDSIEKPKEYVTYLSKIAAQLKPLAPYHLGLTSQGDYHRQALQGQLFMTPFKQFEKKVIILSTFDTGLFRSKEKLGLGSLAPADDLDYWVNAQLYTEVISKDVGVATLAPQDGKMRAAVYAISDILGLTPDDAKAWSLRNKNNFSVVIPSNETNPTEAEMDLLINTMGVNVVPLDIFNFEVVDTRKLTDILQQNTWKLRPLALRVSSK